jgi:glutathione peroxidase-family protein
MQSIHGVCLLLCVSHFVYCSYHNSQEPGTNAEIKKRVFEKWPIESLPNVKLMAKVNVKIGDDQHFIYKYLMRAAEKSDDLAWNFAKVMFYFSPLWVFL